MIDPRAADAFRRHPLFLEAARRFLPDGSSTRVDGLLFGQQLSLIRDPAKRKAAKCSRRAGKSVTAGAYLIKTCLEKAGAMCLYLALTRKSAKRILWRILKTLCHKLGLRPLFRESELVCEFPNGSQIVLGGANDEAAAEDYRGSAYDLVIIDEGASYRGHLDELIDEVLEPALADHDGTLMLIGTPSADFTSLFYKATAAGEGGYSVHEWTLFDNPHLANPRAYVESVKTRKGWSDDNPILEREYFGKWRKMTDEMVYRFNPLKNTYDDLPEGGNWQHVMGMDIGYNDAAAFAVWAFDADTSPNIYLRHCYAKSKLIPAEIAEIAGRLVERYNPISFVADEGGLGKSICEEFRRRYGLNVKAAEKKEKRAFIDLMNSDFHEGRIKAPLDAAVVPQWNEVMWDEKRKKEDEKFKNDLCDAALYGWREARHYWHVPKAPQEPPHVREENEFVARLEAAYREKHGLDEGYS